MNGGQTRKTYRYSLMNIQFLNVRGGRALGAMSIAALLASAACRGDAKNTADSTLSKDLALAGQQTAQPTFQDTAISPAPKPAATAKQTPPTPVRTPTTRPQAKQQPPQVVAQATVPAPTPAPAPAQTPAPVAPAPVGPATIGAGTAVGLTGGTKVCSGTNMPGDKLVATVNSTVTGSNGAVIPAGSNVVLEVAAVQPGQDAESAKLLLRVRSLIVNDRTYSVDGDVTLLGPLDKTKVQTGDNGQKKKVIGGAIAGAILGQLIGHNTKGTVIGAAAGAATGAVVSKAGEKEQWQACLPSGAPLRLTINSPLILTT
jgi:hypothetical protein